MRRFRARSCRADEYTDDGRHRFEHWYRDNTVYFITARCREYFPAFESEVAKQVFWDRFDYWTAFYGFVPWITSLLRNHYHAIGYLKVGENLGPMMQRIHGSVAKLVNDLLPERRTPFWRDKGRHDYFDGCLRDELQCRRAYRYTLRQSVRHGIVADYRLYPHTHVRIDLEVGIKRSLELNAFMEGVAYKRYEHRNEHWFVT
jgi:hypothetical protein